jgi:hypothetical protein
LAPGFTARNSIGVHLHALRCPGGRERRKAAESCATKSGQSGYVSSIHDQLLSKQTANVVLGFSSHSRRQMTAFILDSNQFRSDNSGNLPRLFN